MRIEKNLVRSDLQNIVWGPGSTLHIIWELGAGNWVLSNDIRSLETAVDENHCACTLFDACFSSVVMSIIYSLIARGTTVLVDYTESTGNFHQITGSILQKIPLDDDTKCTYVSGR